MSPTKGRDSAPEFLSETLYGRMLTRDLFVVVNVVMSSNQSGLKSVTTRFGARSKASKVKS